MSYYKISSLLLLSLVGLTACSVMEPLDQSYHWRPHDIYKQNIMAQAENKKDLIKGRTLPASDTNTAAAAIQRWRDDNVKKLGTSGVAELNATGSGDDSSSGSSAAAAGGVSGGGQ